MQNNRTNPNSAPPAPAASARETIGPIEGQQVELLTPAAVADRLGVNTKMLERWRGTGEGPAFVRLTRKTLRYRSADVEGFIAGRVRASTAAE